MSSGFQLLDNLLDTNESTFITIVSAITVGCWASWFSYTIWQLVTRRPVLKIDHVGIHYGQNTRTQIPWDQVANISDPIGRRAFSFINVRPRGGKPRRVPISHLHVDDLRSFALWLRERLREMTIHHPSDGPSSDHDRDPQSRRS
jgi:hypothetical protein